MEIWDEQLATVGAELLSARLDTLSTLMPLASRAYGDIAPVNDLTTAQYRSTIDLSDLWSPPQADTPSDPVDRAALTERFRDALSARRKDELVRGVTLTGPHRDDVVLHIGQLPAKGYASHGESWSLALALRLGSFELLRADGIEPVLVLDDVFAELDSTRRDRLAGSIVDADQVLVTTAVASDVPEVLHGARFDVGGGNVMAHEEVLDER